MPISSHASSRRFLKTLTDDESMTCCGFRVRQRFFKYTNCEYKYEYLGVRYRYFRSEYEYKYINNEHKYFTHESILTEVFIVPW